MPSLDSMLENHAGTHFGFSATRIDNLGASEYTLVTVTVDESGSVAPFAREIEQMIQTVVKTCAKSPRADNLMLRLVTFNHGMREIHGFKLLQDCNPDDYIGILRAGGMTALYDAQINALEAEYAYGDSLKSNDFLVNAVNFTLTDGDDNASSFSRDKVKQLHASPLQNETLESVNNILVGVNAATCSRYLQQYKAEAGFDQYVECGASEKELAKLAQFVSGSISATSQSLGTGTKSQSLTF